MKKCLFLVIVFLTITIIFVSQSTIAAQESELFVPLNHHSITTAFAFSPDHKYVLSGSWDNSLKLWDVKSGRQIRTFREHRGNIDAVFFSPDSQYALSGTWDPVIKLWDVQTGKEVRTFTGFLLSQWSRPFSPDGKQIFTYTNSDLKIIDVGTGIERIVVGGHQQTINTASFSSTGKLAATGSNDGIVKIWDLAIGKALHTLNAHMSKVVMASFSKEDAYLLSGSESELKVWDTKTGKCIRTFDGKPPAVFSTDNKTLLFSSTWDRALELWDIASNKEVKTYDVDYFNEQISSDGQFALSKDRDGRNTVREIATSKTVSILKSQPEISHQIRKILFSVDGKKVIAGIRYYGIVTWDIEEGKRMNFVSTSEGHRGSREAKAISTDGKYAVDYNVLFDAKTGKTIKRFRDLQFNVESAAFSRNNRSVLLGGMEGSLGLYDCGSGDALWTIKPQNREAKVVISHDGNFFISGTRDGSLKIFDFVNGKEKITLQEKGAAIEAIALSPDDKFALTGGSDNQIHVWNLQNGRISKTLTGHKGTVEVVAFSADGKIIASAGDDSTLKLWDLALGKEIATMAGHEAPIMSLAFSPDDRFIATGSTDGTLRLWSVVGKKELAKFMHISKKAWIVVGSHGYYNASPEGEEYLTLRIGNRVSGIREYKEQFFKPDRVSQILRGELPGKPSVPVRYVP